MYEKKFVHQVGKKDYHYIRMHGQQNIFKKMCFLVLGMELVAYNF